MDFANERYVRLYCRDSTEWKRLKFEGQAVWMLLYRKADRSGVLQLAGLEPWEAAALHCAIPELIAKIGVERILERGWAVHDGDRLVFPRYAEANETPKSNAQRLRESRARRALTRIASQTTQNESQPTQRDTRRHAEIRNASLESHTDLRRGSDFMLQATARSWNGSDRELMFIGAQPEPERQRALAAIRASEWCQANPTLVSPGHVVRRWPHYAAGAPEMQAVATKPAKPPEPTELEKLQANWRELQLRSEACLYDEGAKKAHLEAQMERVSGQIQQLKGAGNGRRV